MIHRLNTRTEKEKIKETLNINTEENMFLKMLKGIKKPKRQRSKENHTKTTEMKAAIIEIKMKTFKMVL